MKMKLTIACTLVVLGLSALRSCHGLAVMSVDFGSEWMKVGIVSPGVPMEIVLNKESKRKTPAVISFRDSARTFGEDAQTVGLRFPKNSYSYLLDLLGKNISHPLVKLYQERFPYYEIVADERGTILFKHDDTTFYSPEELIAQFLTKAKEMAELSANQPIKECVIVVPGFFNQVERKAMLQAAKLAHLKVLQLINDYTAVALNYGIFRIKDFNETAQYTLFYDMGASSTTATLVSYQTVKTRERGYVEAHPQLSVIGVGFDRTLGGLEIQLRLRDYLGRKFNEMHKTPNDVFKNPRAVAKLFKEAGRLKNVLSANAEHNAQIEGLLDEKDFKLLVTREDLEGLIGDLLQRVSGPVDQALKSAHLTKDIINQVVLVGAGTRVPKVQEILQNSVGQELSKNLNTDEAATMGAVYKAADLSTGFQVKKFITKDAVVYPIQVIFEREVSDNTIKQVKRTLFGFMNPYPQKKIITFNKYTNDFSFSINYAELDHLPENEIQNVGSFNLSKINLHGIEEALKKNSGENVEMKGIKSHFSMDDSGILKLINVEMIVEKSIVETDQEGTFSKLGNTISQFFGRSDKPAEQPSENEQKQEEKEEKDEKEEKEEKEKSGESEESVNEQIKNQTETKPKNTTEAEASKDAKPKIILHKERIHADIETLTIQQMSSEQFKQSQEKLEKLEKIERELNRRATALNNLESFVIDVQNKLYEDNYSEAAKVEEVEEIRKACSEVSDWLYEDGTDADADTYEKKLNTLKQLTRDLFMRVWEHGERPEALAALEQKLNHSSHFLLTAKNFTQVTADQLSVFTDVEVKALEKLINDTEAWKVKQVEEQNKLKKHEPIKLTVRSISDKIAALDREIKYLLGKLKLWRPKKVEKPVKEEESKDKVEKETELPNDNVDNNSKINETNNTNNNASQLENNENIIEEKLTKIGEKTSQKDENKTNTNENSEDASHSEL